MGECTTSANVVVTNAVGEVKSPAREKTPLISSLPYLPPRRQNTSLRVQSERHTAPCIPVKLEQTTPKSPPTFKQTVHSSSAQISIKLAALIIRVMHQVTMRYTVSDVLSWLLAVMTRCAPSCSWSTPSVGALRPSRRAVRISSIGLSVPLDSLLRELREVTNLVSTCRAPHVVQHSDSGVKGRFAHSANA